MDQVHRDLQGNDKFEYSIEDAVTHPGWDEGLVNFFNRMPAFKLSKHNFKLQTTFNQT